MNVLEYICLDNENKFRSKLVFTEKSIDDVESIIVDSSLIDNVIDSSFDIVLVPTKVVKNPFYRDDRHWLVLCEYRYPTGVPHKNNARFQLEQIIQDNPDIDVGITQEFVLCDKTSPLGWNDKVDIFKNYSGKTEFSQHSEPIINAIIEALVYSKIQIKEVAMTRIVGKWMIEMGMNGVLETCDNLILLRYITQKVCFKHNVICCFNPEPITNSRIYSRCDFYISTPAMRDTESGLNAIIEACEKLKLKHLEHYKILSNNNLKRFTYSQNNINNSVQVILGEKQNGMIKEKRCGSDCEPYYILSLLLKTITTSYSIDKMTQDLELLKERFNYHSVVGFDSEKPKIQQSYTQSSVAPITSPKEETKKQNKQKKTGLSGLVSILKLDEDSDNEDNEKKTEETEETEKNRVDSIISSLKKMKLSHNILQSVTAPKSVVSTKNPSIASDPILPIGYNSINPNQGASTHVASAHMASTHMPVNYTPTPTPPSSLYTLPSQINQNIINGSPN